MTSDASVFAMIIMSWPPARASAWHACAGAGLTALYSLEVEQEVVTTDASVFAMNITGGLAGSGVDGLVVYKACALLVPCRGCLGMKQSHPGTCQRPCSALTQQIWGSCLSVSAGSPPYCLRQHRT